METMKAEMTRVCSKISVRNDTGSGNFNPFRDIVLNADRLACMFFKVPDNKTAHGQPPEAVKKYTELVEILKDHQFEILLTQSHNITYSHQNMEGFFLTGITSTNSWFPGIWCHENQLKELVERMETLEKNNKTLTRKLEEKGLEKLTGRVEELEKNNKTLYNHCIVSRENIKIIERKMETLENNMTFLKSRNEILEKNCIIDYSKYASLIQRYWKKHILTKRVKEASQIYRMTRNFSSFIKPVEMMKNRTREHMTEEETDIELSSARTHVSVRVPHKHTVVKIRTPSTISDPRTWTHHKAEQFVRDWAN